MIRARVRGAYNGGLLHPVPMTGKVAVRIEGGPGLRTWATLKNRRIRFLVGETDPLQPGTGDPMERTLKPGEYLVCRCGLAVPAEQFAQNGYLCPQCRLARILTEYDRPAPDQVRSTLPAGDDYLFSIKGAKP